ncbi:MAG: NDP-sugar synthase [SAR324 cluster bacterium]
MKAFVLAAGLGTRLQPITGTLPKALVPVCGVPMLDRLAAALARGGVCALALNTHHLAEATERHLHARGGVGRFAGLPDLPVRLFHEPRLLGTGGALLNVASFWGEAPLLVWNADILADLDPAELLAAHRAQPDALATLAVSRRPASSVLSFDSAGSLCGSSSRLGKDGRTVRDGSGAMERLAFHGVSVLGPGLRAAMMRSHPAGGAFDLIDALLDAVAAGGRVRAYDAGERFWGSTGSPQELDALERGLAGRPDLLARWSP